jgi:uncharacterized membrane protein HdeD (DUF308 family)
MLARHGDTLPVEQEQVEETTRRTAWSPAQFVAGVIGIAAIVYGAIALSDTGLDTGTLFHPTATVGGFGHTPLLALIEILFGVFMLLAALVPDGQGAMAFLSMVALAFGVVVIADLWEAKLHHWLGVSDKSGWLFVVVGAIGLLAAITLPTIGGHTRVRRVRRAA